MVERVCSVRLYELSDRGMSHRAEELHNETQSTTPIRHDMFCSAMSFFKALCV